MKRPATVSHAAYLRRYFAIRTEIPGGTTWRRDARSSLHRGQCLQLFAFAVSLIRPGMWRSVCLHMSQNRADRLLTREMEELGRPLYLFGLEVRQNTLPPVVVEFALIVGRQHAQYGPI